MNSLFLLNWPLNRFQFVVCIFCIIYNLSGLEKNLPYLRSCGMEGGYKIFSIVILTKPMQIYSAINKNVSFLLEIIFFNIFIMRDMTKLHIMDLLMCVAAFVTNNCYMTLNGTKSRFFSMLNMYCALIIFLSFLMSNFVVFWFNLLLERFSSRKYLSGVLNTFLEIPIRLNRWIILRFSVTTFLFISPAHEVGIKQQFYNQLQWLCKTPCTYFNNLRQFYENAANNFPFINVHRHQWEKHMAKQF